MSQLNVGLEYLTTILLQREMYCVEFRLHNILLKYNNYVFYIIVFYINTYLKW